MKTSRDIVAIGVLGKDSLKSISDLIYDLPADFPASVLIALQMPAEVSKIERILINQTSLPFIWAREGQHIRKGYVYLGSSHASLVTRPWGVLGLEPAMSNDHHHFAITRFFDSAAYVWGNRVIGVLLNSENDCQADAKLASIKSAGGIAVISDRSGNFLPSIGNEADEDESHSLLSSTNIASLLAGLVQIPSSKISDHQSVKMRNKKIYGC